MKRSNIGLAVAVVCVLAVIIALLVGAQNQSYATTTRKPLASRTISATATPNPPVDIHASRDERAWGGVYLYNPQAKTLDDTYQSLTQSTGGHVVANRPLPPLDKDANYQKWQQYFGESGSFNTDDGKAIYHASCAGCHLHQGQGGIGAGYYPPLANNPKMHSADYIYSVVLNGLRGMPYFRDMLSDTQIANVTKYVQEQLNGIASTANAKDVAALRHDTAPTTDPSDH